eukprot:scaffold3982_cov72-Skeletonema_dohrnii-CCMP3373.AAC.3
MAKVPAVEGKRAPRKRAKQQKDATTINPSSTPKPTTFPTITFSQTGHGPIFSPNLSSSSTGEKSSKSSKAARFSKSSKAVGFDLCSVANPAYEQAKIFIGDDSLTMKEYIGGTEGNGYLAAHSTAVYTAFADLVKKLVNADHNDETEDLIEEAGVAAGVLHKNIAIVISVENQCAMLNALVGQMKQSCNYGDGGEEVYIKVASAFMTGFNSAAGADEKKDDFVAFCDFPTSNNSQGYPTNPEPLFFAFPFHKIASFLLNHHQPPSVGGLPTHAPTRLAKGPTSSPTVTPGSPTKAPTKVPTSSPSGTTTMCTCSPLTFSIKITLTSTDPCTTDDLKPNNGIENTVCLFPNPTEELDELIGPHHHQHPPAFTEDENNTGSRKLASSATGRKRMLQAINVDELVHDGGVMSGGEDKDGATTTKDDEDDSNRKEVKPSYYQPPAAAVHQSTLDAWTSISPNDVFFNEHPELKLYQEEIYRVKHGLPSSSSSSTVASVTTRSLQGQVQGDLMPKQLLSAQFLEMDTSPDKKIINQDDSYLDLDVILILFPDPSNIVLQFSSISNLLNPAMPLSDQMEYVPGEATLILVGATASGEIVRNRMLWTYTMGCGLEDYTVLDGNVIGWAGFVSVM